MLRLLNNSSKKIFNRFLSYLNTLELSNYIILYYITSL